MLRACPLAGHRNQRSCYAAMNGHATTGSGTAVLNKSLVFKAEHTPSVSKPSSSPHQGIPKGADTVQCEGVKFVLEA